MSRDNKKTIFDDVHLALDGGGIDHGGLWAVVTPSGLRTVGARLKLSLGESLSNPEPCYFPPRHAF